MSVGASFANGIALHAVSFPWHARLTIIRRDAMSYGVDRFIVSDEHGRRGYAY